MSDPLLAIIIQKTTAGEWDEQIDWSNPARQLGDDTIATSEWLVTGADDELEIYDRSIGDPAVTTTGWMRGGTQGNIYTVTNTITTAGGRTLTGTFLVSIVAFVFLTQPNCI